jgi:predicted RNA-binding Zn-ribbon protein involved in translation (DUF1610 family)
MTELRIFQCSNCHVHFAEYTALRCPQCGELIGDGKE